MELEVLKEAIEAVLQVYVKEIQLDSTFAMDLGADSIDLIQILGLVEEKLEIHIENPETIQVTTVEDALNLIMEAKKKP